MSISPHYDNRKGGNAEQGKSARSMTIEEFEAKVYQILDRPFTIEYLSLYKHKRILVKEDHFYCSGEQIAWCIGSTYEEAFHKMLNLLSGEKQ